MNERIGLGFVVFLWFSVVFMQVLKGLAQTQDVDDV